MTSELPPEVLSRVIKYLYQPLPKPNRGAARSQITQPALAVCMRVSIAFNHHAAPLLYPRVATDRLDLLIVGINDPPANALVESKSQLLSRTRHLHIEHPDPWLQAWRPKSRSRTGSNGLSGPKGIPLPSDNVKRTLDMLERTLAALITHYNSRNDSHVTRTTSRESCFLDSLSFCAYLHQYEQLWIDVKLGRSRSQRRERARVSEIRHLVNMLLQGTGARHYCQRPTHGPLRLGFGESNSMDFYGPRHPLAPPINIAHVSIAHSELYAPAWKIILIRELDPERAVNDDLFENIARSVPRRIEQIPEVLPFLQEEGNSNQYEWLVRGEPEITVYTRRLEDLRAGGAKEMAHAREDQEMADEELSYSAEQLLEMRDAMEATRESMEYDQMIMWPGPRRKVNCKGVCEAPRCEACNF